MAVGPITNKARANEYNETRFNCLVPPRQGRANSTESKTSFFASDGKKIIGPIIAFNNEIPQRNNSDIKR